MAFLSSNTIQPPHHDSLSYRDGAELVRMPAKNAVSEVLSTADRSKESVHKDPVLTYSTVRTPGEGKRLRNRIRKEVEKMKTRVQRGVKSKSIKLCLLLSFKTYITKEIMLTDE